MKFEFDTARAMLPERTPPPSAESREAAETLFRATIARLGSTPSAHAGRSAL
jgi:hypothetical protein